MQRASERASERAVASAAEDYGRVSEENRQLPGLRPPPFSFHERARRTVFLCLNSAIFRRGLRVRVCGKKVGEVRINAVLSTEAK